MATEQIVPFSKESPLHNLQRVNRVGSEIFTCLLFPRRFNRPDMILTEPGKKQVVEYFRKTKKGIQVTTRRDDPNYDPGMHDGKFAEGTGYIDPENLWHELGFDWEGEGSVRSPEVLQVDEEVLPAAKHALLTFGFLNQFAHAEPAKLPFIDAFPYEGKRFWGREMTVGTVYEMIDDLNDRVQESLAGDGLSNFQILPVAQFFEMGRGISSDLMRKIYLNDQIS